MKIIISENQYRKIRLFEGRKEELIRKYEKSLNVNGILRTLDIPFIKNTNYKYADMFLKTLSLESHPDVETMLSYLKVFDRIQKNLEKKDINQYDNFGELVDVIDDYQNKKKPVDVKVDKLYEDDEVLIIKPLNYEASCKYGSGTRWCTAGKDDPNTFYSHVSGGQGLYYVILKKFKYGASLYKLAIHYSQDGKTTWYDSEDVQIVDDVLNIFTDKFPVLEKVKDVVYDDIKEENSLEKILDNINTTKTFHYKDDIEFGVHLVSTYNTENGLIKMKCRIFNRLNIRVWEGLIIGKLQTPVEIFGHDDFEDSHFLKCVVKKNDNPTPFYEESFLIGIGNRHGANSKTEVIVNIFSILSMQIAVKIRTTHDSNIYRRF